MKTKEKERFYIPALDGLRFIAFLLVFIHNAPADISNPVWNGLHEYGWIGVDLFFCLSGYLITKLLVLEHQKTGKINVRNFYIRRALRIFPLYFLYIPIAIFYTIQDQGWHNIFLQHLFGLVTFTYDFVYLFLTSKIVFILVHLWTISYEIQFYVIIPWVLTRVVKATLNSKWLFLLLVLILGNALRLVFITLEVKHPAIYMLPFTHFEALLGGVAFGLGLFDKIINKKMGGILLSLGLLCNLLVFILPNTYKIGWSLMLTYPLVGLGMTFTMLAVVNENYTILHNSVIVFLGKISYGLYVFHLISILIVSTYITNASDRNIQEDIWLLSLLIIFGLILTFIMSSVSFYLFERRFLKIKKDFNE